MHQEGKPTAQIQNEKIIFADRRSKPFSVLWDTGCGIDSKKTSNWVFGRPSFILWQWLKIPSVMDCVSVSPPPNPPNSWCWSPNSHCAGPDFSLSFFASLFLSPMWGHSEKAAIQDKKRVSSGTQMADSLTLHFPELQEINACLSYPFSDVLL